MSRDQRRFHAALFIGEEDLVLGRRDLNVPQQLAQFRPGTRDAVEGQVRFQVSHQSENTAPGPAAKLEISGGFGLTHQRNPPLGCCVSVPCGKYLLVTGPGRRNVN
jgi:hypothetical protein